MSLCSLTPHGATAAARAALAAGISRAPCATTGPRHTGAQALMRGFLRRHRERPRGAQVRGATPRRNFALTNENVGSRLPGTAFPTSFPPSPFNDLPRVIARAAQYPGGYSP